ncbi:MAG: fibronectin type III domain-containing protein, partial [Candidatus Latescibacterota bacterium]
ATVANCGGDEATPVDPDPPGSGDPPPDTIPPAAVTDLAVRAPQLHSLALVWKSPGDDDHAGTAAAYDIRYSESHITDANWEQAAPIPVKTIPVPKPAGQIETIVVPGLATGVMYYFALKTSDETGNQSALSNCVGERTLHENVPPSAITDLAAAAVDETSFELTWTAPGDDAMSGTAAEYDIRCWTRPILDESSWDEAKSMSAPPKPGSPGATESVTVDGLEPGISYYFAVKTADDVYNWSGLSNVTVALAFGHFISAAPKTIVKGDVMYFSYRASPSGPTSVKIHADVFDPGCNDGVVITLAHEYHQGGTHTVTWDFYHEDFGIWMPTYTYLASVCWGPEIKEWVEVHFENPGPGHEP